MVSDMLSISRHCPAWETAFQATEIDLGQHQSLNRPVGSGLYAPLLLFRQNQFGADLTQAPGALLNPLFEHLFCRSNSRRARAKRMRMDACHNTVGWTYRFAL